jgi:two-component sensor histidine kinase/PAS domain-containing protein
MFVPENFAYYGGMMLVFSAGYFFIKLRFFLASIAGWTTLILFNFGALFYADIPTTILINYNFFFISANVIGMFAAYNSEHYARHNFYLNHQLEKQKLKVEQINKSLETKVEKRTAELSKAKESAEYNSANQTAILEGTQDSIWAFDRDYRILYINHAFQAEFQKAFGTWLEPGVSLIKSLPAALKPIWKPRYDKVLNGEHFKLEDMIDTEKGKIYIQTSFNPIVKDEQVVGGSCFGSNITNRKLAEIELQKAKQKAEQSEKEVKYQLSEKETLLKEVQHRIKNNIASIESLLTLQAASTTNPEVKTALQETISRIQSTRVLYEKLLISKDYQEVSLKNYLDSLIDSLLAVFPDSNNISIQRNISDIPISSQKAVTVGIITNELMTNIFKYAFHGKDSGNISIELKKSGKRIVLTIKDDGIGIDDRFDLNKSPGFGLRIVKMLTEQLKGNYSITNEHGTRSILELEI